MCGSTSNMVGAVEVIFAETGSMKVWPHLLTKKMKWNPST